MIAISQQPFKTQAVGLPPPEILFRWIHFNSALQVLHIKWNAFDWKWLRTDCGQVVLERSPSTGRMSGQWLWAQFALRACFCFFRKSVKQRQYTYSKPARLNATNAVTGAKVLRLSVEFRMSQFVCCNCRLTANQDFHFSYRLPRPR
jgi:hypothetical protein